VIGYSLELNQTGHFGGGLDIQNHSTDTDKSKKHRKNTTQ